MPPTFALAPTPPPCHTPSISNTQTPLFPSPTGTPIWAHDDSTHFSLAHVNISALVQLVHRALNAIEGREGDVPSPSGITSPAADTAGGGRGSIEGRETRVPPPAVGTQHPDIGAPCPHPGRGISGERAHDTAAGTGRKHPPRTLPSDRGASGHDALAVTGARTDRPPGPLPFWREAFETYARQAFLDHRPNSSRMEQQFRRRVDMLLELPQYRRRGWEPEAAGEG